MAKIQRCPDCGKPLHCQEEYSDESGKVVMHYICDAESPRRPASVLEQKEMLERSLRLHGVLQGWI